jgi:arylesterase/paraoxonase
MRVNFLALFVLGVVAALGVATYSTLRGFNHFASIESSFDGACTPVSGIAGPEDLQIDVSSRRVFISSFDRRGGGDERARGAIYVFSLDDPLAASGWRDRTGGVPDAFEPLGLYYFSDGAVRRLFVVNDTNKSIELFDVTDSGDLVHLETLSDPRLSSPNNVAAVGPREFYVTNDVEPGRDTMLGRVHFLLRAQSGAVLHYDGTFWRVAADQLRFANGVNRNADATRVYVTETAGHALKIYERDPATGALQLEETVSLSAAPDNINIDQTGALWIAAHPKPLALSGYLRDPARQSPSMVIRYDDSGNAPSHPAEVFTDDGALISASTAADRLGSKLVIGSLLEKKFLICHLAG